MATARTPSFPRSKEEAPAPPIDNGSSATPTPATHFDSSPLQTAILVLVADMSFPYPLSYSSVTPLFASTAFAWLLFLHPWLPTRLTSTYSHHLTKDNMVTIPLGFALVFGIGLLYTWFTADDSERLTAKEQKEMNWPSICCLIADGLVQLAFLGVRLWDVYKAPKKELMGSD